MVLNLWQVLIIGKIKSQHKEAEFQRTTIRKVFYRQKLIDNNKNMQN